MVELSIRQVEIIKNDISKEDIFFSHLQDDLIDHVCCDVESHMQNGLSFEEAYMKVKKEIGLKGLQQIQIDTLLLIDKNYRIMKTTMKITGVIAPVLLAISALFKINHWPGAGIMLTLGFFILIFFFLPSAVYVSYREVSNKSRWFLHTSGLAAAIMLCAGYLFKIQHWPGAGILLLGGIVTTAFVFIPVLFIGKYKQNRRAYLFPALLGSILFLMAFLFKANHWEGASIIFLIGVLLLFGISFPWFVYQQYRDSENVSKGFIFFLIVIVLVVAPLLLMRMTVSFDYMKAFEQSQKSDSITLQCLSDKNHLIYQQIQTIYSGDNNALILCQIRNKTDSLYQYMNKVKSMSKSWKNSTFFELQEEKKIKQQMENYRVFLTKQVPDDSNLNDFINQLLNEPINKFDLHGCSTPSIQSRLSNLQQVVRIAETEVLIYLKNQFTEKTLAKAN